MSGKEGCIWRDGERVFVCVCVCVRERERERGRERERNESKESVNTGGEGATDNRDQQTRV